MYIYVNITIFVCVVIRNKKLYFKRTGHLGVDIKPNLCSKLNFWLLLFEFELRSILEEEVRNRLLPNAQVS